MSRWREAVGDRVVSFPWLVADRRDRAVVALEGPGAFLGKKLEEIAKEVVFGIRVGLGRVHLGWAEVLSLSNLMCHDRPHLAWTPSLPESAALRVCSRSSSVTQIPA